MFDSLNLIGESILLNHNDNYLITGWVRSSKRNSLSIIHNKLIDENGELIWAKSISDSISNFPLTSVQTSDNNYVIAGYSTIDSLEQSQNLLFKLDTFGNIIWKKRSGQGIRNSIQKIIETNDQLILAVGSVKQAEISRKAVISIYNQDGDQLWSRIIGQNNSENVALDVIEMDEDGFLITGWRKTSNTSGYLIRIDTNGNVLWEKEISINEDDICNDIEFARDGNILVSGFTGQTTVGGFRIPILIKMDIDGNIIWMKEYQDSENYSWGGKIVQNENGNLYLLGNSEQNEIVQLWILKLNEQGDELSRSFYGDSNDNWVSSFAMLENSFLGILSNSESFDESTSILKRVIYFIKINDKQSTQTSYNSYNTNIIVSPNPTTNTIRISIDRKEEISSLKLVDLNGNEVFRSNNNKIDSYIEIGHLISGTYILFLMDENGHTYSRKIVKI